MVLDWGVKVLLSKSDGVVLNLGAALRSAGDSRTDRSVVTRRDPIMRLLDVRGRFREIIWSLTPKSLRRRSKSI